MRLDGQVGAGRKGGGGGHHANHKSGGTLPGAVSALYVSVSRPSQQQ